MIIDENRDTLRGMTDLNIDDLNRRLVELRIEHRDLDEVIAHLSESVPYDQLQIKRLKKRKLLLKDLIARIENAIIPDIIA